MTSKYIGFNNICSNIRDSSNIIHKLNNLNNNQYLITNNESNIISTDTIKVSNTILYEDEVIKSHFTFLLNNNIDISIISNDVIHHNSFDYTIVDSNTNIKHKYNIIATDVILTSINLNYPFTYIYYDTFGNILVTNEFTSNCLYLCMIKHLNNIIIDIIPNHFIKYSMNNHIEGLNDYLKFNNSDNKINGCYFIPVELLKVQRTNGKYFELGVNYNNDKLNPNILIINVNNSISFIGSYNDSIEGNYIYTNYLFNSFPLQYDDLETGILQSFNIDKWYTIPLLYNPVLNINVFIYPQFEYDNELDAMKAGSMLTLNNWKISPIFNTFNLQTFYIIRYDCSDLSNIQMAHFYHNIKIDHSELHNIDYDNSSHINFQKKNNNK